MRARQVQCQRIVGRGLAGGRSVSARRGVVADEVMLRKVRHCICGRKVNEGLTRSPVDEVVAFPVT